MENILMRNGAPLTPEQWQLIDATVSEVINRIVVGRRILDLYGPLGYGAYTVPLYTYSSKEGEPVRAKVTRQLTLSTLMKDFIITAKDLDLTSAGQPFDTAPVAATATQIALAEDKLIFEGDAAEGSEGLLNATGRQTLPLGNWNEEGQALADISTATATLVSAGFYPPYYVAMHPMLYTKLQRVYGRRGILEIELLEKQATGGVFATPAIPQNKVLVIAAQPQYVDLAVGLDIATGFIETVNLEHRFAIMETLALRIKQPGAICTLE
ncbi:MAG TPA: family 1 encapsulin nanocompartment shell protein [Anaerolineae bacterium]|nr:family 1 encapsulin nanocompartment shell protein [Anaerolineae bacterium]HQK14996.1 family 1 encapsulin nanocompartment shell protein [Anaerolineae bacterium]